MVDDPADADGLPVVRAEDVGSAVDGVGGEGRSGDDDGSGDDGSDDGEAGSDEAGGEPPRAVTVAGVLLAAGESSRFDGRNKLLVELQGDPLVTRAARSLDAADVELRPAVAVVGHESERVREALAGTDLDVVENPDHRAGQATSVRTGVGAVDDADAVVFALGDMPAVRPGTVEDLIAAYRAGVGEALAAAYGGERGNPVLFGRTHFDALADVRGDAGGREILLGSDDAALVETGDPGVLADVDSPGDLAEFG